MEPTLFTIDGKTVPVRIRISARSRRVSLRFSESGLEIVRPARLRGDFSAAPLLQKFSSWIRRQMSRHGASAERRHQMEGKILLRGHERRLVHRNANLLRGFESVREEADTLLIETTGASDVDAADQLRTWIFAEARRAFTEALRRRSIEMGQPFGRLAVRDQKWLWGSCSPASGTVSLNARLIMAPSEVLDYIVVHELAHFRWRGHGARFWDRVARFCADHKIHRRWLRENAWKLRFPPSISVSTAEIRTGQQMAPLL